MTALRPSPHLQRLRALSYAAVRGGRRIVRSPRPQCLAFRPPEPWTLELRTFGVGMPVHSALIVDANGFPLLVTPGALPATIGAADPTDWLTFAVDAVNYLAPYSTSTLELVLEEDTEADQADIPPGLKPAAQQWEVSARHRRWSFEMRGGTGPAAYDPVGFDVLDGLGTTVLCAATGERVRKPLDLLQRIDLARRVTACINVAIALASFGAAGAPRMPARDPA